MPDITEQKLLRTYRSSGFVEEMTEEQLEKLLAIIPFNDSADKAHIAGIVQVQYSRAILLGQKLQQHLAVDKKGNTRKISTTVSNEIEQLRTGLDSLQNTLGGLTPFTRDFLQAHCVEKGLGKGALEECNNTAFELFACLSTIEIEAKSGGSKAPAIENIQRLFNLYESATGETPKQANYDSDRNGKSQNLFLHFVETFFGYMHKDILTALKIHDAPPKLASLVNEAIKNLPSSL